MNPKLKLRAWDNKRRRFFFGESSDVYPRIDWKLSRLQYGELYIRDFIIQLFTGWKDCDSKDIYDGDILEEFYEIDGREPDSQTISKTRIVLVEWDNRQGRWATVVNKGKFHEHRNFLYLGCYKIIGNIFENPELLA